MANKIFQRFILILSVAAIGVCFYSLIQFDGIRQAEEQVCNAKGGVVVLGYNEKVCIQTSSVIQVK